GIRDFHVTGVQTCALPILPGGLAARWARLGLEVDRVRVVAVGARAGLALGAVEHDAEHGRADGRELARRLGQLVLRDDAAPRDEDRKSVVEGRSVEL